MFLCDEKQLVVSYLEDALRGNDDVLGLSKWRWCCRVSAGSPSRWLLQTAWGMSFLWAGRWCTTSRWACTTSITSTVSSTLSCPSHLLHYVLSRLLHPSSSSLSSTLSLPTQLPPLLCPHLHTMTEHTPVQLFSWLYLNQYEYTINMIY